MTDETEWVIAITGGHSHSTAMLLDLHKGVIGAMAGTRVNLHTDPKRAADHFFRLIDGLETDAGEVQIVRRAKKVVIALAGAAFLEDQNLAASRLSARYTVALEQSSYKRFVVVDDTWAGLVAGTFGLTGTCACAGTGASVFVGDGTQPTGWQGKIDGWGAIIGDFGSGFQMSVDFMRQLGREEERTNRIPPIFESLRQFVATHHSENGHELHSPTPHGELFDFAFSTAIDDFDDIQRWFDDLVANDPNAWRIGLASIAAVITRSAEPPVSDPLAMMLIENAAKDFAESIRLACNRFDHARVNPIVLQGGMFDHSPTFKRIVLANAHKLTSSKVFHSKYRPVVGAAVIAASGFPPNIHNGAAKDLMSKIDQYRGKYRSLLINPSTDSDLCLPIA
ncbi:MAG TPA: hypothetical protein VMF06_05445 [Candidatus Limnocylindria bacterium]|jgi:N-acetylglucosamine kinase-like BadF-type ATPase|nr:hypothetical protein [Candidatus Limnocylindria bacterium]